MNKDNMMEEKISLLVPTRRRPENMFRVWDSSLKKSGDRNNLEIIFYIDDDDSDSISRFNEMKSDQVKAVVGKRICLSECWNKAFEIADGNILWHGGDDNIFRTPVWDEIVRAEFRKRDDKMIFVFGKDGIHDEKLGTHGFLHRKWVDVVGYFAPPYFVSDYNDEWFNEVFEAADRKIFKSNFLIEHMHWIVNKSKIDETHSERLARHEKEDVDSLYVNLKHKRDEDVEKILEYIKSYRDTPRGKPFRASASFS